MSSSGSASDTTIDLPEQHSHNNTGSKRKSVIDTRRAEQNRAAQRAFRHRKEIYVKELESKVRDMEILKDRVDRLEKENDRLKHRIWELETSSTITTTTTTATTAIATTTTTTPSSPHVGQSSFVDDRNNRITSNENNKNDSCQYYDQHQQPYHTSNSINETKDITNRSSSNSPPITTTAAAITPPLPSSSLGQDIRFSNTSTITSRNTGNSNTLTHPILPPPSPSPSVFRPIPVAYWDKKMEKRQRSMDDDYENPPSTEQGRVLDDLASILRTRHRPPIRHQEQQHQEQQSTTSSTTTML
ncbi:uncharacterized protein BX664DRAFT_326169, partial [Halteromyces radiatus]|uniref:uncharacterized protein n=1 Tax=Halteromyces radiatus TaxID=101107 RepID=UPI002220369E